MQIAIDARALSHPQPGGFKTYTYNLVRALLAHDRENQYVLYLDRPLEGGARRELAAASQRVIRSVPGPASVPLREQLLLPSLFARQRPDVVHFPCGTGPVTPTPALVATIHDAIELLDRSPLSIRSRGGLKRWMMG